MIASVRKVHPVKRSRNGNLFIRVEFVLEDGSWAETDICPDYRNYSHWTMVLDSGVGTEVSNLLFKDYGRVNADSYPVIVKRPESVIPVLPQPVPVQMFLTE